MPDHIIKLPEVKSRSGLGRSSIYEAISRGEFPQPIKLGPRSVGWVESEIDHWLSLRKAARGEAYKQSDNSARAKSDIING